MTFWSPGDIFSSASRFASCEQSILIEAGRELLSVCNSCELVILNGLRFANRIFDGSVTRPASGQGQRGSVIDYFLSSEALVHSCSSLKVVPTFFGEMLSIASAVSLITTALSSPFKADLFPIILMSPLTPRSRICLVGVFLS